MPKLVVPLTDAKARNAKAKGGIPLKLYDGGGLFLLVTPEGKRYWRFRYIRDDDTDIKETAPRAARETTMALGEYPAVSLARARELRETLREELAAGIDPVFKRKAAKTASAEPGQVTVRMVGQEWFEKQKRAWSDSYCVTVQGRLDHDVYPYIGDRTVDDVDPPEIRSIIQRVESRGATDLAHKVFNICDRVFKYAVATGRRTKPNPASGVGEALGPHIGENFPAVTKPKDLSPMMRKIDNYEGTTIVQAALKVAPRVFARPIELRSMEWVEIDFADAMWTVPAKKMKRKREHSVPLARQVIEILADLRKLTGKGKYVFPSLRPSKRPISDGTINAAMVELGIPRDVQCVHGFRATARTILAEVLKYPAFIIDHQLSHLVKDPNGTAYDRTAFLDERRVMMQRWADYLDELKQGPGVAAEREQWENISAEEYLNRHPEGYPEPLDDQAVDPGF